MSQRHQNKGLRKVCGCARRAWSKCKHPWHFNFRVRGGTTFRFSVDVEAGKRITWKTEAEALAEGWRQQIRAGTFRRQTDVEPTAAPVAETPAPLTLSGLQRIYIDRAGIPVSVNTRACFRVWATTTSEGVPFGERPVKAITQDELEVYFAQLREQGRAASTRNKFVQTVKMLFRWAVQKGHLERNPADGSRAIRREKHAQRNRRLEAGEEAQLLAHAGPHLYRLIVAALETGCRKGELLGLTWRDVDLKRREITLQAERTKTRTGRVIPVSARLAAVLAMANTDPEGKAFSPEAHVFGDAIGGRIRDVKRAWETCVLKANGHTPAWTRNHSLRPECRAAFEAVNLTFHDLRHEAGSRLLESGWQIHNVAQMLGHANISQTSTYLNATRVGLQDAMRRLDASRCNPVANEALTDQAPLRNEGDEETGQALVN